MVKMASFGHTDAATDYHTQENSAERASINFEKKYKVLSLY